MQTPQPIHFAKTTWENDSLYSEQFGDIYFSVHGGREESTEVYLNGNRLAERFSACSNFVIGEIGFGTILNFALTLELWKKVSPKNAKLFYLSYEKYPLENSQIKKVLSSQRIHPSIANSIVSKLPPPVESTHLIDLPEFRTRLILYYGEASEKLKETAAEVDAWFLDGFSPSKNPECWSEHVLKEVSRLSHGETTASTFSVAGAVKERLKVLNWDIQKVSASGTKKQTLNAQFKGSKKARVKPDNLRVCVVGGGLAGCAVANSFSRRGANVSLFESRSGLALAASGNNFGVVLPYPSRGRDIPHRFFTAAFSYLTQTLNKFGIERSGVLFQPLKDRDGEFFDDYAKYEYPPDYAQIVSSAKSSELSGIELSKTNLYFPGGGMISFPELCDKLVSNSSIVHLETKIESLKELIPKFDIVVLASGSNFELFPEIIKSFVHPLKGEVGLVRETDQSKALKIPVCDRGYLCPSVDGVHMIGSTYQRGVSDEALSEDGEAELGKVFNGFFPEDEVKFISRRAGIRVACKDRMPVVGEVEGAIEGLRLFVTTAHGSRGGVSTLLSGELLAAEVYGEPLVMEMKLSRGISVGRIKPVFLS